MSEPQEQYDVNSDPTLSNAADMSDLGYRNVSYRNSIPTNSTANVQMGPPVLPPRLDLGMQNYGMNQGYSYGGMGNFGMNGGYGMNSFGGFGGFGGNYGMGGMGMPPYGGFNRFGPMYGDMESRFIQMAEDSARPAFESLQGFVNAFGSIAMMLDNTFFAFTSSFRAILGVAENFGRLRSLFAQVWSTLAVVRTFNWMIRKLCVILGIRTESEFKAWAEAVVASQGPTATPVRNAKGSSWPILMFFGIIVAAPYLVLKMFNGLSSKIYESLNDPSTWQNPLRAVAQHDYQANTSQEISFSANQVITIAPYQLQSHMWNTGWLMGSTDRQHAGLVPVTYIKLVKPSTTPKKEPANVTEKPAQTEASIEDLNKYYGQEL